MKGGKKTPQNGKKKSLQLNLKMEFTSKTCKQQLNIKKTINSIEKKTGQSSE